MLQDRILTYRDLHERFPVGRDKDGQPRTYSRKHLIDLVKRGQFPAPIQVSPNRIGWLESALDAHADAISTTKPRAYQSDAAE